VCCVLIMHATQAVLSLRLNPQTRRRCDACCSLSLSAIVRIHFLSATLTLPFSFDTFRALRGGERQEFLSLSLSPARGWGMEGSLFAQGATIKRWREVLLSRRSKRHTCGTLFGPPGAATTPHKRRGGTKGVAHTWKSERSTEWTLSAGQHSGRTTTTF